MLNAISKSKEVKQMGSIRWVWKYIRTYWLNVSIGIALVIFVALLNIVSPLIGGRIVDDVIVKGEAGLLVHC